MNFLQTLEGIIRKITQIEFVLDFVIFIEVGKYVHGKVRSSNFGFLIKKALYPNSRMLKCILFIRFDFQRLDID